MVPGSPPKVTGLTHGDCALFPVGARKPHKAVSSHGTWEGVRDQGDGVRVSESCLLHSSIYRPAPGCSPVFPQLYPQPLGPASSLLSTNFVRKLLHLRAVPSSMVSQGWQDAEKALWCLAQLLGKEILGHRPCEPLPCKSLPLHYH